MNITRTLSLFITSAIFMGCFAQQTTLLKKNPDNNTVFWQITGKGLKEPSYLFGTFHLMCKEDIHFGTEFIKAIKQVREVYLEMNLDDPATLLSAFLYINMAQNKKLKDLYSNDEYDRLEKYFHDSLNTSLRMFQKMKPYFLVAMLYPKMLNCKTPSGIEEEIMKLARENKKKMNGLETMAFQASVFDSIPYEWQAKELLKNIDSFPFYKRQFDTVLFAYKNQQMDELARLLEKNEFGSDAYQDLLLKNRNLNWVKQIQPLLQTESVLIAVGAGHLTGRDGLIKLFGDMGYQVTPIYNK